MTAAFSWFRVRQVVLLLSTILSPLLSGAQSLQRHNLRFDSLATRWDEAVPLGNGMLGALVWRKENTLRFSLDRADLWDERKAFPLEQHNFKWVQNQVANNNYSAVQQWGDSPYDSAPYPTKLPAAALYFDLADFGEVESSQLDIETATHTLIFSNGTILKSFIHATKPVGYFEIIGSDIKHISPRLLPHLYEEKDSNGEAVSVVDGQRLARLGYKQGQLRQSSNKALLHQTTYGGRFFEVLMEWEQLSPTQLVGMWTITNNTHADLGRERAIPGLADFKSSHLDWWGAYWSRSSISIPDALLEKQYYLEMYKLGSVARAGAPAITLQAVWTADNGGLPPWKGDFHNDLNTQLSYWPAYTGNRMAEAKTFTDWLWKVRPESKKYTKQYFEVDGLNIPGVLTLNGYPMGGWIQYALSPTVSAWTAQHYYWQWKYSMDNGFLKEQAYTYITEAATYLKNITLLKADGKRYLPLSSSPEYNNNSIDAWFTDWTNFDLGLAHFLFAAAAEVNQAVGAHQEAEAWRELGTQLPLYAVDETGMLVAVGHPMEESHRHMSPYMAIYPLGLLDINDASDVRIIRKSLRHLERLGTKAWVGYSFSWMACLYARAKEADAAVLNLQKFAQNFCSVNSFHVNGDQKGGQFSAFTYRPFTLEGNFAFAQGIHELLIQSKNGYVEVFPATPSSWKDVSFENLRTEGAFLVSAAKVGGEVAYIQIVATADGTFCIRHPKPLRLDGGQGRLNVKDNSYSITLKRGQKILLKVS